MSCCSSHAERKGYYDAGIGSMTVRMADRKT